MRLPLRASCLREAVGRPAETSNRLKEVVFLRLFRVWPRLPNVAWIVCGV